MEDKNKMFAMVKLWEKSGLTRKAFAIENEIKAQKFNYWCTKYFAESVKSESFAPKFIEIATPTAPDRHMVMPKAELEFPSGIKITIY